MRLVLPFSLVLILSSCFGSFSEGERYFRQSEYEKAVSEFSKALFFNVTDIKSLHLRARSYEELGDLEKAKEDYLSILRLEPNYAQAHAGIGKLLFNLKDYKNAENYLLVAAKNDPEDFDILFLLGRTLMMNRRYESADDFFQLAKDLRPEDSKVYFYQGMARSQIGDVLGAAGSFNMCLKYDPDNLVARYNRGLVLKRIGHISWALEDFEAVLKAKPEHVEALAHRGMAKLMKQDPTGCIDLQQAEARGSHYAQLHIDACR
jgi:tetratricopeptide (TPR) repeat protein